MSNSYIYYPELIESSFWGKDKVLIDDDINLLTKTEFNLKGYGIFSIKEYNDFLKKIYKQKYIYYIGKRFRY